jgi:hypothetical protein
MNVKTKALEQAIKMLDATGAQYKIISAEGNHYGELVLAEPAKPKSTKRYGMFTPTCYTEQINAMKVGEVVVIAPPEGATPEELRSVMSGHASKKFGAKNHTTSITEGRVELLRLA